MLETELTNIAALRLYERLGFVRDKRLPRYYMNGNDAFRLRVWVPRPPAPAAAAAKLEAPPLAAVESDTAV